MSAIPTGQTPTLISGDTVEVSGIYRVQHWGDHTPPGEVVLIRGFSLPACEHCGTVTFRLVHAAPSIQEDADFWRLPRK
jgi:hypothetical protein